jgi:hypothetical protein
MVDGLDVLYRVALGILLSNEDELLRCGSIPAVYVALENLPTRMWQVDKVLQVSILFPSPAASFYMYTQLPPVGIRPENFTFTP